MQRLKIIILSLLLVALSMAVYVQYYYTGGGPLSEETTVRFKRGMGFVEIVDTMGEQGVIRHPLLFKAIAVLQGDARKFKAGEYKFSAAISPRLVMEMIAEGRVVVHKITVAEGLSAAQVVALLSEQEALEGVIALKIDEGSLLPQTYHFVYGDQRQDIISRMQAAMKTTLDELWPKRAADLPISTPAEAVILASIIEKETGVDSERRRVAAVFTNRLKRGMKLQSDPTVIYGIEKGASNVGRVLTGTELRTPTPYNSYTNYGLPPTPITNPGRASLEAALNPAKTDDLYFVATGTGGHNFSATLDGHNKNVKSYRSELKKQKK